MAHPNLLDRKSTALVVIDVQEAFRNVIPQFEQIAVRISTALRGFHILEVPIIVTEQYPKGLGPTVEEITLSLPEGNVPLEKRAFSACGAGPFMKMLEEFDVSQIVICGIETHVCVSQTAHDLLERGVEVHVAQDAVTSRTAANKQVGLHKMEQSGAIVTSVETALFELLGAAGSDEFKQVQGLVK